MKAARATREELEEICCRLIRGLFGKVVCWNDVGTQRKGKIGMLKVKEFDRIVSEDCMLDTKGKLTRLTLRQSENR